MQSSIDVHNIFRNTGNQRLCWHLKNLLAKFTDKYLSITRQCCRKDECQLLLVCDWRSIDLFHKYLSESFANFRWKKKLKKWLKSHNAKVQKPHKVVLICKFRVCGKNYRDISTINVKYTVNSIETLIYYSSIIMIFCG